MITALPKGDYKHDSRCLGKGDVCISEGICIIFNYIHLSTRDATIPLFICLS
jgi:hypothetical protein